MTTLKELTALLNPDKLIIITNCKKYYGVFFPETIPADIEYNSVYGIGADNGRIVIDIYL